MCSTLFFSNIPTRIFSFDEDITPMAATPPTTTLADGNISSGMEEKTYRGPITRSHAKEIQN